MLEIEISLKFRIFGGELLGMELGVLLENVLELKADNISGAVFGVVLGIDSSIFGT